MRRPRARELARLTKNQGSSASYKLPPVNLGISRNRTELNRDVVMISDIDDWPMSRLETDFRYGFQGIVVIVDSSLAGRTELDSFHKRVLRSSRWISNRILERSKRCVWRRCISDSSGAISNRRSSIKS